MLREVRLKPEFAAEYPELSPARWYTAAAVAGLVKGCRIIHEGLDVQFTTRILQATQFEFRGGQPRRGCWMGIHTRRIDRHPCRPGSALTTILGPMNRAG
jgi:hypothetical protein